MSDNFFRLYGDIRKNLIGSNDDFRYYNADTMRPIKTANANKYNNLILYSYNERLGYKGLTWLNKTKDRGVIVCKNIFDQNGEIKTLNELFEAFSSMDFEFKPEV